MSDYPDFIVTTVPFRGKKVLHVILLLTLAAGLFLTLIAAYVTSHKHEQPAPARSRHAHPAHTAGTSLEPGTRSAH